MWSQARQAYCLGLIPSFFIREEKVVQLIPNNAAAPSDEITVEAISAARFVLFGGEPLDGPRHVWWNFVSSSRERIKRAKED
jgi:redox-sensitive bicupin YhaK (pirin superfamily)